MKHQASCRCKVCGAILPESLICEYCGADHSPEFRAKFDDKGVGILEYQGQTIQCYLSQVRNESLYMDGGRDETGRILPNRVITKRIFEIVEM